MSYVAIKLQLLLKSTGILTLLRSNDTVPAGLRSQAPTMPWRITHPTQCSCTCGKKPKRNERDETRYIYQHSAASKQYFETHPDPFESKKCSVSITTFDSKGLMLAWA